MMISTILPFHPRTGLQAIGFTRRGPIWPIIGGAEDGDDDKGSSKDSDNTNDDTDKDTDGDKGKDAGDKTGDTKDDAGNKDTGDGVDWKARSRQNENAKKASDKKLKAVLAALGVGDDGELTPQQLKEKFEQADADTKGLKVENAVIKAASKAGVDADELTDSKKFMSAVADLDPSDSGFTAEIKKLIDAEVKRKPSLKTGGGAGSSGSGGKGGSSSKDHVGDGGKKQLTRDDLKNMSPAEIVKAQKDGLLKNLTGTK